jgi:large subunit ribosomal protein L16
MLQPKRTKFRKQHKGRYKGVARRGYTVDFGDFAIKVLESGWLTARQLEASRVTLSRALQREGKIWLRVFPDKPVTKKPAEVRMGKGKGNPEFWVADLAAGNIVFEVGGVDKDLAINALTLAAQKLPLSCKIVQRRDCQS